MRTQLTDKAFAKLQTLAGMHSGEGVNNYLLSVVNHIRHEADSPEDAKAIIRPYLEQARAERSSYEIESELNRQVGTSFSGFVKGEVVLTNNYKENSTWPEQDEKRIAEIAKSGPGLHDLWESSPVRWGDDMPHTEEIIDLLFPGNPLLCVGESNSRFETKRRERLRGRLSDLQLIVPSPMSAFTGEKRSGGRSAHTLDNTGPRRFLVVEFDFGYESEDKQSAIIWHLAKHGKLVLALHSGNKSIHAWFYCAGSSEAEDSSMCRFMKYAVALGGDFHGWTRCQFMRMPDGINEKNGKRQNVYYFNAEAAR